MSRLQELIALGFEDTTHIPFTKQYRVKCNSCEALVINGVPCHETGCRNQTHECKWCGSVTPPGQRFCEESCAQAYCN